MIGISRYAIRCFSLQLLTLVLICPLSRADSWLTDPNRVWHLSFSAREGWTDNVDATAAGNRIGSFTTSLNPSLSVLLPMENTTANFGYSYIATFFTDLPDRFEQSHAFNASVTHVFTPRLTMTASDTLIRGIEPTLATEPSIGAPVVEPRRGDYWNNRVSLLGTYKLTERWTTGMGGAWEIWRFDSPSLVVTNFVSGVNDRDTYSGNLSATYAINPVTTIGVRYTYARTEYLNPNLFNTNNLPQFRDARNYETHTPSITFGRQLSPKLSLNTDAGVMFQEFDDGTQTVVPSLGAVLTYTFQPEDIVSLGFRYGLTSTETGLLRTSESATLFLKANHHITQKLSLSARVKYSHHDLLDPDPSIVPPPKKASEDAILVDFTLFYDVTHWCSIGAGYSHDEIISDLIGRQFSRNQAFLGVTFTY